MNVVLPVILSGEAEKEYWKNFRGSHEKFRESKGGNRGRFVLLYLVLIVSPFCLCSALTTTSCFYAYRGGKYHRGGHKHGRSRDDNNGGRPNKHRKF